MRFTPKTEKQIQEERFPVLTPGMYHFEVMDAKEMLSKKGAPMIVLRLKILDSGLNVLGYVQDYIMESFAHKLRSAAYGCGLGSQYESGELNAEAFMGTSGTVELVIQKDKTGQYPDRNSVLDYVKDLSKEESKIGSWDDIPEPPHWAT